MGSAVHQSRNYIAKSHLQHGSKSWIGVKLTADKFEEKFKGWYTCELISQETDSLGDSQENTVVIYEIQVSVHLSNAAPMVYHIRRRFKQWSALHEELMERDGQLREKVPGSFPGRTVTRPSPATVKARADYFRRYLEVLINDSSLANLSPLLSFLELNSIVQSLAVGTVMNVELTSTHTLQGLKKVVAGLEGVIYLRVDLRLSKVMVKGFLGSSTVVDAIKEAGFNIVLPDPPPPALTAIIAQTQ